jgi:hypothetical protein
MVGKVSEIQNGFVQGHGCMDGIFVLRQLTGKCIEKNKELYLVFVYLRKAYNFAP